MSAEPGPDNPLLCSVCGSSLFGGGWPDGDEVAIRLGSLDGLPRFDEHYA